MEKYLLLSTKPNDFAFSMRCLLSDAYHSLVSCLTVP